MPPSPVGADAVLIPSMDPARLDESLLRLARRAADAATESVLHELVATLGLAAASLWDVEPEHGIPGRTAWVRGGGLDSRDSAEGGDAGLPAVMRLFDARVDLHAGAPSPDGSSTPLHIADAGIWRGGSLTGCLRCERAGVPFDARETTYLGAVADRVALLAEERERRGAQERLREREMKLDEVEQLTRLGSWEWDVANDVITWSPEQLRLHGADPSLRSQTFAEFLDRVHPADRRCVVDECAATLATGVPFSFPYRIVREDGTEREMQALGKLLPGTGGATARLVGVSRDVTELMQAERALRASEESYRAIFENVSDGIWVHDPRTGELLDINPAAGSMFGYTKEEMLAAGHDALLYPGTEYTAERVADYMARTAAGETPRFEWLGRHRDGSEVWGEVTMRRVTIGGAERILASVRDIAERKAAERALQRV
ncbi:MAG TPA: PAS domain S-box protein, partial [Longimicrobiaceae bacterium]